MDPVSVGAVLLAVVTGVAGEAGGRVWEGLVALVRRPSRRRKARAGSGEGELAALEAAPDEGRAVALAQVLLARAGAEGSFRRGLEGWWSQASQVSIPGAGSVTNTISGGTQQGPVFQGRDFSGLTFTSGPLPPPSQPPGEPGEAAR